MLSLDRVRLGVVFRDNSTGGRGGGVDEEEDDDEDDEDELLYEYFLWRSNKAQDKCVNRKKAYQ